VQHRQDPADRFNPRPELGGDQLGRELLRDLVLVNLAVGRDFRQH